MSDRAESLAFYRKHAGENTGPPGLAMYTVAEMKLMAEEIDRLEALVRDKDRELDLACMAIRDLQEESKAWQDGFDEGYSQGKWDAEHTPVFGEVALKAEKVVATIKMPEELLGGK